MLKIFKSQPRVRNMSVKIHSKIYFTSDYFYCCFFKNVSIKFYGLLQVYNPYWKGGVFLYWFSLLNKKRHFSQRLHLSMQFVYLEMEECRRDWLKYWVYITKRTGSVHQNSQEIPTLLKITEDSKSALYEKIGRTSVPIIVLCVFIFCTFQMSHFCRTEK